MKNNTRHHRHQAPLASCEARARLALERGLITQAAYQTLMGISTEALLTEESEKNGAVVSWKNEKTFKQKQITPCDTPPTVSGTSTPPAHPEQEYPLIPKLELSEDCVQTSNNGEVKLSFSRDTPHKKYLDEVARSLSLSDSKETRTDIRLLEMRDHGFGLCARARRYWSEAEGLRNPDKDDERLLEFMDMCLKTYPPGSDSTESKTPKAEALDSHHDFAWQNRLGLVVMPSDDKVEGGGSNPLRAFEKSVSKEPNRIDGEKEIVRWEDNYKALVHFKDTHGHCNVPYRFEQNRNLGCWVQRQRSLYRRGKLSKERHERLNEVGVTWAMTPKKLPKINDDNIRTYDDLWDYRYNCLIEFKKEHGHCNVPYRYAIDLQLGRWVQNQREFFKRRTLSTERYQRLAELGFIWYLRKGGKYGVNPKDVVQRGYSYGEELKHSVAP